MKWFVRWSEVGDRTPMETNGGASRADCSLAVTVASSNYEVIRSGLGFVWTKILDQPNTLPYKWKVLLLFNYVPLVRMFIFLDFEYFCETFRNNKSSQTEEKIWLVIWFKVKYWKGWLLSLATNCIESPLY